MATGKSRNNSDAAMNWETPEEFFLLLHDAVGGFKVDAAADESNHLVNFWYGPGSPEGSYDALEVPRWESPAFCNPPYLRGPARDAWLDKFKEQADLGVLIVSILPAATGTKWFAEKVVPFTDLIFLKGRLPFWLPDRDTPSQPNHDSVVAVWGPGVRQKRGWMDWKARLKGKDV